MSELGDNEWMRFGIRHCVRRDDNQSAYRAVVKPLNKSIHAMSDIQRAS